MGVYVYTMRSRVIEASGLKIGMYAFAYKPWGGWEEPKHFTKAVNAKHRAAAKNAEKNKGITLFVTDNLKPCSDHGGVPVYEIRHARSSVYDDAFDRKAVGVLVKQSGAWVFRAAEEVTI